MMPISHLRRSCVVALVITQCVAAGARGDVLIRQAFDGVPVGVLPVGPQPVGTIGAIEADGDRPLGGVTVAKVDGTDGSTSAAQVANVAHKEQRAPGLLLRWNDPKVGIVRVEYRFMTPIDGPFLGVHFFGGDWKSAAAVLMTENGKVVVQFGEKGARLTLGVYEASVWQSVRLDFDVVGKTVDVYLNGRKRANRLPWQGDAKGVGRASLLADFKGTDHGGAPVLYVDDIVVQTVPRTK